MFAWWYANGQCDISCREGRGFNFHTCNAKSSAVIFEELKDIENWVAWSFAELCKAEKGVQKDKRNQRRTKLVRGV